MRTGELYQRYYGLYLGTVRDVDDPEGLGRVRVETDQYDDQGDPVWATVARPAAGDGTGVEFAPKVGDQVVLGYLVGDVDEPIVLGFAHFRDRRPPDVVGPRRQGVVTEIGSIVFEEDARRIVIAFKGSEDTKITLDDNGIRIDARNVCINGHGIVLTPFLQAYNRHVHVAPGDPPKTLVTEFVGKEGPEPTSTEPCSP